MLCLDSINKCSTIYRCSDSYSDTVLGYANSIRTIDGGTHIDGLKASLTRTINNLAKKSKTIKVIIYTLLTFSSFFEYAGECVYDFIKNKSSTTHTAPHPSFLLCSRQTNKHQRPEHRGSNRQQRGAF
jgi:hypothetical protein